MGGASNKPVTNNLDPGCIMLPLVQFTAPDFRRDAIIFVPRFNATPISWSTTLNSTIFNYS